MAISKHSKRFQITLNEERTKDKVILDYLKNSYNPREKIKEILYSVIINKSDTKLLTVTQSKQNDTTNKGSKSDAKLLTMNKSSTNSNTQNDTLKQNEMKDLSRFI